MIFTNKHKKCRAITKDTDKRCSKSALRWSPYCYWHQPKKSTIIVLIVGAILGVLITNIYEKVYPPETVARKKEVFDRIKLEAAKTVVHTDLTFELFFQNTEFDLYKRIHNVNIKKGTRYVDYIEFVELKNVILNMDFYKGSNTYNKEYKQLTLLSAFIRDLYRTYELTEAFLDRYGSVDDEIVTIVLKLDRRLETLIHMFSYVEKNKLNGNDIFVNGVPEQHADFLTDFFFHQVMCQQFSGYK